MGNYVRTLLNFWIILFSSIVEYAICGAGWPGAFVNGTGEAAFKYHLIFKLCLSLIHYWCRPAVDLLSNGIKFWNTEIPLLGGGVGRSDLDVRRYLLDHNQIPNIGQVLFLRTLNEFAMNLPWIDNQYEQNYWFHKHNLMNILHERYTKNSSHFNA